MLISSDPRLEEASKRAAKLTKLEFQHCESGTVWLFSSSTVKISIIIVHFFGEDHLTKCLNSIPKHPAIVELIVVDNGSEDGFVERIGEIRKNVIVVINEMNIGYGAAANKALPIATGDTLLIINQDIVFHNDTLSELILSIEQDRSISLWGAELQNMNGVLQGSAGPFPTIFNWMVRLFRPKRQRKYYRNTPNAGSKVDWITGAFFAVSRSSFKQMKGFNENYFMYYEDVDICHRAKYHGFLTGISSSKATHSAPISEQAAVGSDLVKTIRQGQLRYFNEYRPQWEFLTLLAITRVHYFFKGWEWKPTYL